MTPYYIASCSCGRDSAAMVYELVERGYPLNEIVFYSNGMDFDAIYRVWGQIKSFASSHGITCTELSPREPFLFKMFDKVVKNKDGSGCHNGYSWCGGRCRWGTTDKISVLDAYCESKNAFVYVGIAFDEQHRKPDKPYKFHPLKEWRMTEKDCLICSRKHGVSWLEETDRTEEGYIDLYDILDRVSCYCCANKNQWELYNIWRFLPRYWRKIKTMQEKNTRPFKSGKYGYTIHQIEKRFENGYIPKHRIKKEKKYENQ